MSFDIRVCVEKELRQANSNKIFLVPDLNLQGQIFIMFMLSLCIQPRRENTVLPNSLTVLLKMVYDCFMFICFQKSRNRMENY